MVIRVDCLSNIGFVHKVLLGHPSVSKIGNAFSLIDKRIDIPYTSLRGPRPSSKELVFKSTVVVHQAGNLAIESSPPEWEVKLSSLLERCSGHSLYISNEALLKILYYSSSPHSDPFENLCIDLDEDFFIDEEEVLQDSQVGPDIKDVQGNVLDLDQNELEALTTALKEYVEVNKLSKMAIYEAELLVMLSETSNKLNEVLETLFKHDRNLQRCISDFTQEAAKENTDIILSTGSIKYYNIRPIIYKDIARQLAQPNSVYGLALRFQKFIEQHPIVLKQDECHVVKELLNTCFNETIRSLEQKHYLGENDISEAMQSIIRPLAYFYLDGYSSVSNNIVSLCEFPKTKVKSILSEYKMEPSQATRASAQAFIKALVCNDTMSALINFYKNFYVSLVAEEDDLKAKIIDTLNQEQNVLRLLYDFFDSMMSVVKNDILTEINILYASKSSSFDDFLNDVVSLFRVACFSSVCQKYTDKNILAGIELKLEKLVDKYFPYPV